MTDSPYLASRLHGFGTTIFAEMSALAVEKAAINLGQGFPDTDGPPEMLEAAEPDIDLVTTLMSLSGVIPQKAKATARLVVRKVVDDLKKKLDAPMKQAA